VTDRFVQQDARPTVAQHHGHTPGAVHVRREGRNPDYPLTLDLRRAPEPLMEGAPFMPSEMMQQSQQ
jgi:hypothetical protein